jgi:putative ABC transport system permease protein
MDVNYQQTNPASATLLLDRVDAALVQQVRQRPEIAEAEARQMVVGRIQIGPDEWRNIWLFVIDDFNDLRLDTFTPEAGQWPPAQEEILLERVALSVAKARVGDRVAVKIPNGSPRELHLVGTAHAPGLAPAWMEGFAYGFITRETAQRLGAPTELNELKIRVADNALDKEAIRSTAYQLKGWLEQQGRRVTRIDIPEPGRHPHARQMDTLLFLLESFGVLALILSAVLVANMISALLSQQIRQIGVMKAIGANARQITSLYLGIVLFLGSIALVIGLPIGVLAGRAYATLAAEMLNFKIYDDAIPLTIILIEIAVGLGVPVLVAAYPIRRGSRITVRQAIGDYGLGQGKFGRSVFDRWLGKVRGLSRPFLLSLRNTFRRRGRLVLTLGALSVGGAGFIVALNVGASMDSTVAAKFDAIRYDIQVRFSQPYPAERIAQVLSDIAALDHVETWSGGRLTRVYADGTESQRFNFTALPSDTTLMTPPRVATGRWLQPGDQNAVVINHTLLDEQPDLQVGSEITLKINNRMTTWQVVGIVRELIESPAMYANAEYFNAATDLSGLAQIAVLGVTGRDQKTVWSAARSVERALTANGFDVYSLGELASLRQSIADHLLLIAMFLIMMSTLVIIVGGLGLASTMSLNVIERTREIGVLRAIGASSRDILRLIVMEGGLIGLVSWLIALVLAWPISAFVSYNFGLIFFETPLEFAVSLPGMFAWLGIAIGIAAMASFFPARSASRLTVREVLAYE